MKQEQHSTGCAAYATRRLRQRETAGRVAGYRFIGSPNGKRGQSCSPARVDANNSKTKSGGTRVWLPARFSRTLAFLIAICVMAVKAVAQTEVGEIAPRNAPQGAEAAVSELQGARSQIQKHVAAIASQAEPLARATEDYRANSTPDNAMKLLHREAVVAAIGARESLAISGVASKLAATCGGLSAACSNQANLLRPAQAKAGRARDEHSRTRTAGFEELRRTHEQLVKENRASELQLTDAERRKIAKLIRIAGSAQLSERFLAGEADATAAVIARLDQSASMFAARQASFADLAEAHKLHSEAFTGIAGSVGRLAVLFETDQKFKKESELADQAHTELAKIDEDLNNTFRELESNFGPAFAAGTTTTSVSSPGLWDRFLRMLGISNESKPAVAVTETGGTAK